ncbi:hypothetical protein HELRODRAFT_167939 [Helobdella robusta]|uniref:XPG-I domain-containing protein n=1 Tax=Helobdella robusta TaxID=6412 RepID=T1EZZ6_HELRO|nr:hypothetical protein HELRODRAFT_167939 [Helobdella robusta]ESO10089.1 hypothetical protein HELRODRAFT_167939 [Helobdella robusta]
MGVKHLWSILAPVKRHMPLESLHGQMIAVDLSIWIVEAQNHLPKSITKPHLRHLFFRVIHLLQIGIIPLIVIEGIPPNLKQQVMKNRLGQPDKIGSIKRSHFNALHRECCQLLECMGLPYVQAAGEAEAMCAYLNQEGVVDGCITNDGDAFLYGARMVFRHFTINQKDPHVEAYNMDDVERDLGLNRESLVGLAILCGCDYLPKGVGGCGKGLVISEYMIIKDKIPKFNRKWRTPNPFKFADFALMKMEWPEDYSMSKMVPLMTLHDMRCIIKCQQSDGCIMKPSKIVKQRIRQGGQCYEVQWSKIEGDNFTQADYYTTFEDQNIFEKAFPDIVEDFGQMKLNPNTKTQKKAVNTKSNEVRATKDASSGDCHGRPTKSHQNNIGDNLVTESNVKRTKHSALGAAVKNAEHELPVPTCAVQSYSMQSGSRRRSRSVGMGKSEWRLKTKEMMKRLHQVLLLSDSDDDDDGRIVAAAVKENVRNINIENIGTGQSKCDDLTHKNVRNNNIANNGTGPSKSDDCIEMLDSISLLPLKERLKLKGMKSDDKHAENIQKQCFNKTSNTSQNNTELSSLVNGDDDEDKRKDECYMQKAMMSCDSYDLKKTVEKSSNDEDEDSDYYVDVSSYDISFEDDEKVSLHELSHKKNSLKRDSDDDDHNFNFDSIVLSKQGGHLNYECDVGNFNIDASVMNFCDDEANLSLAYASYIQEQLNHSQLIFPPLASPRRHFNSFLRSPVKTCTFGEIDKFETDQEELCKFISHVIPKDVNSLQHEKCYASRYSPTTSSTPNAKNENDVDSSILPLMERLKLRMNKNTKR